MVEGKPIVRATEIGEYIRHHSCERRFKLEHNNRALARQLPFVDALSSFLDPVLQEAGHQREREWEDSLRGSGLVDLCRYDEHLGEEKTPWEVFIERAQTLEAGQA